MCTGAASADSGQTMMFAPRCGARELAIQLERRLELRLVPLHFLRHGALHDRDRDRRAGRLRPFATPQREAEDPDRERRRCAAAMRVASIAEQQRDERARGQRHSEAHAVDAAERREARERRVGLRVAEREPGEAAEEPAAEPFEHGDAPPATPAASASRRAPGTQRAST